MTPHLAHHLGEQALPGLVAMAALTLPLAVVYVRGWLARARGRLRRRRS